MPLKMLRQSLTLYNFTIFKVVSVLFLLQNERMLESTSKPSKLVFIVKI